MALLLIMAQQSKAYNANTSLSISAGVSLLNTTNTQHHHHRVKAMFHDFLGMKPATTDSPVVLAPKNTDASPSASVSVGAASSGGARGPFSTTSDLASGLFYVFFPPLEIFYFFRFCLCFSFTFV